MGRRYAVRVEPDEVKLPNNASPSASESSSPTDAGLAAYHALVAQVEACAVTAAAPALTTNATTAEACVREVVTLPLTLALTLTLGSGYPTYP